MRVVITDCDHDAIAEERAVAVERKLDLELFQCRSEDDVIAAASDADAIVVQYAPITARVLDALPRLRAIGRYGVGVDTVDVAAATARGVAVCNVPDYGTEDVSDHAIALALSLVRGVTQLDRQTRDGAYRLSDVKPLHRISALTLGVVGVGRIGAATARKAAALGFTVLGHDPRPGVTAADVPLVGFDQLLAQADVVSLHVPLDEHTKHLIDDDALARMTPGAMLVNTCRGGVVDTAALVRAIRSGHVKAAALDVFEEEPLPTTSELLQLPSVVVTPHTAWYSEESESELKRRAIENVVDYCAGHTPRDLLNPEVRR